MAVKKAVRPKKSTKERSRAILNGVIELVADLASHAEIVRYCAETWHIQERQAENYIARARKELQESVELSEHEHRTASRIRWQGFIERAREAGNLQAEARALQAIDRLYLPEKTGKGSVESLNGEHLRPEAAGLDFLAVTAKAWCTDPAVMIAAVENGTTEQVLTDLAGILRARRHGETLFYADYADRLEKLRRGAIPEAEPGAVKS